MWLAVLIGAGLAYLQKLLGFLVPNAFLARPVIRTATILMPISLLAALVAVQTFAVGTTLVVDARVAGLAAAVLLLVARAPFIVVVLAAAAATAAARALA